MARIRTRRRAAARCTGKDTRSRGATLPRGTPGGYGAPQQGGYGMGGGGRPRTEPTADDLERTMRTIHVAGIRGLRASPASTPVRRSPRTTSRSSSETTARWLACASNGSNCWIEFADVNGAEVALLKDGTESGGHNLRVSRSKTPIRSNGYAAGRAKQQAALAATQSATAAGAPMGTSMAAAAQQHQQQSATRAPATQMSPAEIVDSINAALNEAIDAARIAGTLVTPVPPVPVSASAAATAAAPATTVVKMQGVPGGCRRRRHRARFSPAPRARAR